MSADNRTITRGRHIGQYIGRVSVDISTDVGPICRSICRPTHLGRHIDRLSISTDLSVDISTDTQPICQPRHRSSIGRYVDRYIGRGVHKIHMIRWVSGEQLLRSKSLSNTRRCARLVAFYWIRRQLWIFSRRQSDGWKIKIIKKCIFISSQFGFSSGALTSAGWICVSHEAGHLACLAFDNEL